MKRQTKACVELSFFRGNHELVCSVKTAGTTADFITEIRILQIRQNERNNWAAETAGRVGNDQNHWWFGSDGFAENAGKFDCDEVTVTVWCDRDM